MCQKPGSLKWLYKWILLLIKWYHTEKQNSKNLEALFDGQWQKNFQTWPTFLGQPTCQPSTHWLGFSWEMNLAVDWLCCLQNESFQVPFKQKAAQSQWALLGFDCLPSHRFCSFLPFPNIIMECFPELCFVETFDFFYTYLIMGFKA